MKPSAFPPNQRLYSSHAWWVPALLCLAPILASSACTMEQEREDEQPTAEAEQIEDVEVADLADQPDVYAGQPVRTETSIRKTVSDRSMFVGESDDQELLVTVLGPEETLPELEERQKVRMTGQVAGSQRIMDQIGNQLDDETRQQLEENQHALVVAADDIEILEEAPAPEVTEVDFRDVVTDPESYADQHIRGETEVLEVIDDRGAYLGESEDERLFSIIRQAEDDTPEVDLKPRQRIRIEGEVMQSEDAESELGEQLSSEIRLRTREQAHVLVADAADVEVLEEAPKVSVRIGDKEYGTFEDWDIDGDQEISRDEFMTDVKQQEVMNDLSDDGDDALTRDEFQGWMMSTLDRDDDGSLSQEEFQAATNTWRDVEWGLFEKWNTDDDQMLSDSEFESGLEEVGVFDDWDADGNDQLGPDEFADGLFDIWDQDGDGTLTANEIGFERPEVGPEPEASR